MLYLRFLGALNSFSVDMRIVFDANTLRQSKMGSVTGVVYFDFDKQLQFPVAGWDDFVVVIANWWIAALEEIDAGPVESKLRFMDGPYWISIVSYENSKVLLRCTDDRRGTRVVYEVVVNASDVRSEVMKFARELLQVCTREGIRNTDDIEQLKRRLLN